MMAAADRANVALTSLVASIARRGEVSYAAWKLGSVAAVLDDLDWQKTNVAEFSADLGPRGSVMRSQLVAAFAYARKATAEP